MTEGKVKNKDTLRISQKDLLKLLEENKHMSSQVTELQTRGTELVNEVRDLKSQLKEFNKLKEQLKKIENDYHNSQPPIKLYQPDIYFDGKS